MGIAAALGHSIVSRSTLNQLFVSDSVLSSEVDCFAGGKAATCGPACRANAVLQVLSGYRGREIVQRGNEDSTQQLEERTRIANFFVSQELSEELSDGAALETLEGKWDMPQFTIDTSGASSAAQSLPSSVTDQNDGSSASQDAVSSSGIFESGAPAPLEWSTEARAQREAMWTSAASLRESLRAIMAESHQAYFEALLPRPAATNQVRACKWHGGCICLVCTWHRMQACCGINSE